MNRQLLDALYQELFEARSLVSVMNEVDAFPGICKECGTSTYSEIHRAELTAAEARVSMADKLITLVVDHDNAIVSDAALSRGVQ